MDSNFYKLKTNPELKRLVPPLTTEEREKMISSLCDSGSLPEIRVWFNTILVDYECYEYCVTLDIPFVTVPVNLQCFEEALIWVCKNQLKRESVCDEMQKYLLGKRSLLEAALGAHEAVRLKQRKVKNMKDAMRISRYEASVSEIRKQLGREYYVSASTIRKYEQYALILDRIAALYPKYVMKHLSGKAKIPLRHLEQIAVLPEEQFKKELKALMSGKKAVHKVPSAPDPASPEPAGSVPEISIKDMPAYDPDAELSSLTLTTSSWTSSINRVIRNVNLKETTAAAMEKLQNALFDLKKTADDLLYLMRRENDERIQ